MRVRIRLCASVRVLEGVCLCVRVRLKDCVCMRVCALAVSQGNRDTPGSVSAMHCTAR